MLKIGILPTYTKNMNRPFLNTFSFINNYSDKIKKNKAIPIGIIFPNGKFDENLLKIYDGFLIPGGSTIRLYHILTIHYAITNNKPLLGICMGMQALGIYSIITNELKKNNKKVNYTNISNLYTPLDESKYLKKVKNHNKEETFYINSIAKSSHKVYIKPNTILKNIYHKKVIIEPSIHNFVLKEIKDNFIINAKSKEGYIEGIELNNKRKFVLGIQFHPEMETKNNILFKTFIDNCKEENKRE